MADEQERSVEVVDGRDVMVIWEREGHWFALYPSIKGCFAFGATKEGTIERIGQAIKEAEGEVKMAEWEYTTAESNDPLENQSKWLNEMAEMGWRLIGIWNFNNFTVEMGVHPCAKFFFERPHPDYLKRLKQEQKRQQPRRPQSEEERARIAQRFAEHLANNPTLLD